MIALLLLLAQAPAPALTGGRSVASKCEVSDDPRYGYSRDMPIRVGGLPFHGPARQQRFLRALTGPAGQPVRFARRGTVSPDKEFILIDRYDVTYEGLERPVELYLDLYRWEPPKAPAGFLCASAIGLTEPDEPNADRRRLAQLAIAAAASGDRIDLIPLGADGSHRYGSSLDAFRLMAHVAGELSARGTLVPEMLAGGNDGQFMVIAHPLSCEGRTRKPRGIAVRTAKGEALAPAGDLYQTDQLRGMLPSAAIADDAVGARFGGPHLPPGGEVVLSYDGPACPAESDTVTLPVEAGHPQKLVDAAPVWPAAVSPAMLDGPAVVQVRARIGVDGVPGAVEVLAGPAGFEEAALDAVRQWRYAPFTINGAPAYAPIMMTVRVTFSLPKQGGLR